VNRTVRGVLPVVVLAVNPAIGGGTEAVGRGVGPGVTVVVRRRVVGGGSGSVGSIVGEVGGGGTVGDVTHPASRRMRRSQTPVIQRNLITWNCHPCWLKFSFGNLPLRDHPLSYIITRQSRTMTTPLEYISFMRPRRPDFLTSMTPAEQETMQKHLSYVDRLFNEGKIILGGAALDGAIGILILRVESAEEARSIYEHDPAVIAGIGDSELHPFKVGLLAGPGVR
jgi:uncharacterized protein YciI